jgi:predicted nucleotidyltransferase
MATIRLPTDFKEFLQFLNSEQVEYLLVGGHAVGYHGYPRATGDMDIWIAISTENADRVARALVKFGFSERSLPKDSFLQDNKLIQIGVPPLRIDILTSVAGVEFAECYAGRCIDLIDGVQASVISLNDLKLNKAAANRPKDQDDLLNLP